MLSFYAVAIVTSLVNKAQCESLNLEHFYTRATSETRIVNEKYHQYLENLPLSVLPVDDRKKSINELYSTCLENTIRGDFKAISSNLLHKYYVLLSNAYSVAKNKDILKNIIFVLEEKQSRGENIGILADSARELALQARDFKTASDIENRFKLKNYQFNFDTSIGSPEYTFYKIIQNKAEPVAYKFLEEDIIVVSSPNCNPSKRFIEWYKSEGRYGVLKGKKVFFLLSQDVPMTTDTSIYNNLEYGFSYKDALWKGISYWATPTFYYWKKGNLINVSDGWKKGGVKKK